MVVDKTKLHGSVKRFGVRYGTKLKGKIGKIEAERRASTKCPHCNYNRVTRISAGIWYCKKCKNKFTGKAYTIGKPAGIKVEEPAKAVEEAPQAAGNFGEEETALEDEAGQDADQVEAGADDAE